VGILLIIRTNNVDKKLKRIRVRRPFITRKSESRNFNMKFFLKIDLIVFVIS